MQIISYDYRRLTDEQRRMTTQYPREFLRGWEEAQGTSKSNADAGIRYHNLSGPAADAYRGGWSAFVLRRPQAEPMENCNAD